MATFRSPEQDKKYTQYRNDTQGNSQCALCEKTPLKTFTYWKVIENSFPYDLIAQTHHMLVPIRHTIEKNLTQQERQELSVLKETFLNDNYDCMLEPTQKLKTIPTHFHIHLIVAK